MATKKKEKTVQELLREKQLEQIENFSIDDGEEEHSLDQILEAASQQGLLELYNPFEERAKKIAEEEAQAPQRPSESQTARQTFDQLGNLGNMVKKTETETIPKITDEAIKNYNLSKVGRDYLSKYDDSTSYADIKKDIAEVQSKRDEDSSKKDEYDLAFAMLNNYINQKYDLNGTDLSQDAIKRRQEVYDYNQNIIDDLNSKVEANEGDTESLNLDDEETVSKYLNHDKDAVDFFMGYRSGRITQDAANQEKYITMRDYIENAANSYSVRDLRNEVENLRAQNAAYDRAQGQSDRYALQYGDDVKNEKSDLLAGTLHTRNNVPDNFDERVENGNDRFTDMGDISQPAIKRYGGENAVEDYNNMDAHTEMLTSEEKGIYSYLLRNEGEASANAYLDNLKDVLQKRASETTQEYIDNASGAEKAVLLAASVPMNVYGTVTGFAEDAANIAAGKDIHPYSEAHSMYNIAQQTRSSVAEDIDEATNSWNVLGFSAGDAFQAAMSIPDFMLGSLTPSYYAASMSMGAAQSTAKELWEEGATNDQIVAESVLSGAAEYVFEKVSLDKILDTADKSKLVKSALAGMAIEGSEEANTEIANIISDVLVRGSQSEWHKAIQNYKDQGYSDSESQAKAFSDMAKRVGYSAIGGAIGGAGGGAGVAIEKGAGLIQGKSERNKYIASVGADVTNAGNTQALLDTADQMKDNAEVQAQAQKVRQAQTKNAEKGTESTAKTLSRETGKLYAAIQDSNAQGIQNAEASEIKAAIKQAYAAETGEDVKSDTVTQAAEAIYKSEYTGEKLTRAERNLASTSQAQSAVESVRNNPDLIESATQKAQERGFRDYVETAKLTQKQEQETKTDDDVDIAEFNYHEDDGKVYTSDGKKQVDIASVASIGDNDITFNLNDGQTESAKALDMPTNQAVLAQSILDVQKKIGVPLTADIANTLYQGYEQSDSPSVSAYMQDAQTVLFNGYANNTAPDSSIKLPQGLRNQLYSMGRQLAASHTQAQQQAVIGRVKGNKPRKGSVTFVDGIKRGQLDSRRRAGVDTVENLAKSLGFDVVFYRSTKNGKGRYSSEYVRKKEFTAKGQQAPSGFWRGGKMYLDINAGMNGEGLILFTASHELVHMIREGSPEDFKALADFLVKNYAEQGVNINDLVLKEMNKSTNLTRNEAFEEVIAESCEPFLRDTHLNGKAQELYKQNPTLWSRIREALKRIINSIKEAYAVARPQSEEARITNRADIETLEKAYDLWTKGIIKSAQNLRNMESNRTDTKYQGRAEAQDTEYLDAVERGDMKTAQRMVDEAAERAFADSKIRDEDGNLIKVYHGTDADFTVFDRAMGRANMDIQGMFFSPWDIDAGGYGSNVRAFYLNITNPADESTGYKALNSHKGENYAGIKAREDLERMGYNGVNNSDEEYIAFNSEQIKLADPVTYDDNGDVIPLSERFNENDKDIRYQSRNSTDNIAYKYAVKNEDTARAQKIVDRTANRVFANSKVRGKDGKLRKVYHYTNTDFYSFDTGRSGKNQGQTHGDGIYISTSPDEFSYAGKKRMTLYANITNPFEMELAEDQARDVLEKYAVTKHNLDQYDGLYRNHAMNALQSPIKVFDYLKEYADDNGIKVSEILQDLGFDGVHDGSEWVAFSSEQLKSADPITYDDYGKVIPLSQRFDSTKSDIRYQSRDDDLFSIELSDDDDIADVAAREFVTHHEDMGEVLKNIADIDIEPKRVDSIINRVAREYLGSLDAEAKHTLSIEIQLALERVNNTDAQTVSDTIIDAVRRAIEKGTVSDERAEANYKDLLDAFKGKKFYLSDEQINQLKEHDMTLDSFRKAMFGKMTIVKRENAKRSINGGYADAQQLSLEGLHDVLADADAVLGLRSWQWDQEDYDAPYIIKEAFDGLNRLRNQPVSQVYSDQAIDDMAVAMSAKITGGIVEAKYKSKYHGKNSVQIKQIKQEQTNANNDYIDALVDKLTEQHDMELAEQKKRNAEKLANLKTKERKRANKREKELTEHYKEQRAKSVEKRNLTKQKNIVARKFRSLDQKLNRADKNKTVKEGLRPTAAKLLEVGNMLFPETRSLEQIAREGVADATPAEQKLLDRYVEYLDIREKTTTEEGRKHASAVLANIRKLLSNEGVMVEVTENGKTVKKKMPVTARERMRYDNAMREYNGLKLKTALSELEDAYRTVKNSSLGYIADSYDSNIVESIQDLRDDVGNTLAKDMTADQLKTLNDIITDTLTSINNANKLFTQERSITDTANAVIRDIKNTRVLKDSRFTIPNKAGEFLAWNNFKPIYAMRYIGSDTFTDLFWKLQKGESDWYVDIAEAKEFKDDLDKKYGVGKLNRKNKTDFNYTKKATFTALDGSKFTLNLDQMMDIYAASRREQALQHLTNGGFTFAKDVKSDKFGKIQTGAKVYQLTAETIDKIVNTLTSNEKSYVEEMQEYLSTVMADKGNEVSMKLHGLKLFNEETYWSISSTDIYAPQSDVEQEQKKDLVKKIRNAGFTKKIVKNASNPIVLQGFETKWSSHVNDMSLYHSMTLPLEDFTRVANYKERGQGATATTGVRGVLIQAYGNAASNYINQLIDDLNGGIQQKMRVGLADNLVSLAKKGAVLNNLSVVIQQPSAVFRAMAYIDKRYFMMATGNKFWSFEDKQFTWNKHNKMYEDLIKYAPVAGIKRMGSFDTGAGRGVIDYLSSGGNESLAKRAYNKGEDIASFLPEFADELAWLKLWQAVQHETKAKYGYKIGSEENKVKSGERFTEVVHLTQVYDSTLSRSQSMRGKDFGSKMFTAFMAEPTAYMNMAVDAVVQSKRTHNFKQLAKTMSALSLALVANALLVAIPRAMRDDDDYETFDEKYMQAFWEDIGSGINPFNYFPVLKDISSIVSSLFFKSYEPSRMDLVVVSDTTNTIKKAYKNISNGEFTANDVIDIIGSVAAWGGISVKNLVRDIRSVINTAKTVKNPRYNKEVDKMGLSLPFAYQKAYDKAYDQGYSETECKSKGESAARGEITKALKNKYLKALKESDSKTMSEIMQYMSQSGYYNKKGNTVDDTLKKWRKDSDEAEERAKVAEERKSK